VWMFVIFKFYTAPMTGESVLNKKSEPCRVIIQFFPRFLRGVYGTCKSSQSGDGQRQY
jgi:hypothetical protein